MKNILVITLLLCSVNLFAQRPDGGQPKLMGRVSGVLIDSLSSEPLPYAAIVVRDPKTQTDINGTISEGDGTFRFSEVPVGSYQLIISFVGYAPMERNFSLTKQNPDYSFGNLLLVSTSKQLEDVVVTGQRDLIENKIDKIVYNAEQDVANMGGDASDVLRRAPLLNVDLDGNVSLRGSSNVQILINGKPSSMFSTNPGDALKSIPSDQIKSVEVITAPGAKYDGEGTAGIINIITKKSTLEGMSGNVDLTAGNRQTRGTASLNGATGRFGFNLSGSSFYSWPLSSSSSVYRENVIDGQTSIFTDVGDVKSDFLGYFGNMGAFYDFNAYNSLSTSFRLRSFNRTNNGRYLTTLDDPTSTPQFLNYQRFQDAENENTGFEWSLDYIKKFAAQEGRELSVSYKMDRNISDENNEILQNDLSEFNDPDLYRDEINFNDGTNNENTLQVDYVQPMGAKSKIETGAKVVIRDVVSDYTYLTREMGMPDYMVDNIRSNNFIYDQNVYAGYLSSNFPLSETVAVMAGLRYERTYISGLLDENSSQFDNQYDNFLPSVTISKNLTPSNVLKLSYNQRIQRPGLRQINPYVNINNEYNISYGNPNLEPEITQQLELNYSAFIKKVTLNTSVFYKKVTDVIENITTINDENISETTFQNIGSRDEIGMNIFISSTFFDIWTVRGGVNFSGFEAQGVVNGETLTRQAFVVNGNINSNLKLGKDWIIDLFGFYRAPQQTVQGYVPSFSIMNFGVRKTFLDERLSLGIRIVEPFFENKTFKSKVEGPGYLQTSEFVRPFRSFGLTFSYRFGKFESRSRTRNSRIENNDVKQEDNSQGQF